VLGQSIFQESNRPAGECLGVEGARFENDAFDIGSQLGLRPDEAIDPELLQTGPALERQKIFPGHETERAG